MQRNDRVGHVPDAQFDQLLRVIVDERFADPGPPNQQIRDGALNIAAAMQQEVAREREAFGLRFGLLQNDMMEAARLQMELAARQMMGGRF
jgi:hypothetical protein